MNKAIANENILFAMIWRGFKKTLSSSVILCPILCFLLSLCSRSLPLSVYVCIVSDLVN